MPSSSVKRSRPRTNRFPLSRICSRESMLCLFWPESEEQPLSRSGILHRLCEPISRFPPSVWRVTPNSTPPAGFKDYSNHRFPACSTPGILHFLAVAAASSTNPNSSFRRSKSLAACNSPFSYCSIRPHSFRVLHARSFAAFTAAGISPRPAPSTSTRTTSPVRLYRNFPGRANCLDDLHNSATRRGYQNHEPQPNPKRRKDKSQKLHVSSSLLLISTVQIVSFLEPPCGTISTRSIEKAAFCTASHTIPAKTYNFFHRLHYSCNLVLRLTPKRHASIPPINSDSVIAFFLPVFANMVGHINTIHRFVLEFFRKSIACK